MKKQIVTLLCVAGMMVSAPTFASNLKIKSNAPQRYTVKHGDTLWGISKKYLYRPWKWPQLWNFNKKAIRNPHRIYPGQVLVLRYVNGRPVLSVDKASSIPTIRLHPQLHDEESGYGIAAIDVDFYKMFMKHPQFFSDEDLQQVPRLVKGADSHLMYVKGDRVYADGLREPGEYLVFRNNRPLIDPETGKKVGNEIEFSGEISTLAYSNNALEHRTMEARQKLRGDEYYALNAEGKKFAVRTAQPAMVTEVVTEVREGDYLIKKPADLKAFNMMPHAPEQAIRARIINVMGGAGQAGSLQTLTLNRGALDGLDKGTVLGIYRGGEIVKSEWGMERNALEKEAKQKMRTTPYVNTPSEEIGLAMVYRVGDHVSSAIILESTTNVELSDVVAEPGRDLETFGNEAPEPKK